MKLKNNKWTYLPELTGKKLMVTEGELIAVIDNNPQYYKAGDTFTLTSKWRISAIGSCEFGEIIGSAI